MKKLLFLCLLLTAFSCKPADFEEISQGDEKITIISNGTEFQISKKIALKFSQTIKDLFECLPELNQSEQISFGPDIVKPEILEQMLLVLGYAHNILIKKPISLKGSYRQLADQAIPENVNINSFLELISFAAFLGLDERIKQAIALATVNHMRAQQMTCENISNLILTSDSMPSLFILPYIAQQYYLLNDNVPEVFEDHLKEIGIAIRDLLIHEKPFNFISRWDGYELRLNHKYIKDLEGIANIQNIDQIRSLYLNNNQIQAIPADLNLPQLSWLHLNNNQIQTIPADLNLPMLSKFCLNNNQIQAIPADLNLPQLEQLELNNNQIKVIPDEQLNLPQLWCLELNNNQIQDFPANLNLPQLRSLCLNNNQIQDFSAQLNLPQLGQLELNNNLIQAIPANLNLPQLVYLELNNNQIQAIPEQLNLPQLIKGLYLNNNQIQDISADLNLPQLSWLYLNNNQIQDIPADLALPQLVYLYLNNNQIQAIPADLALPRLVSLELNNNQIQAIPEQLNLSDQRSFRLELNGNQVQVIGLGPDFLMLKIELNNNPIFHLIFHPMNRIQRALSNPTAIVATVTIVAAISYFVYRYFNTRKR